MRFTDSLFLIPEDGDEDQPHHDDAALDDPIVKVLLARSERTRARVMSDTELRRALIGDQGITPSIRLREMT